MIQLALARATARHQTRSVTERVSSAMQPRKLDTEWIALVLGVFGRWQKLLLARHNHLMWQGWAHAFWKFTANTQDRTTPTVADDADGQKENDRVD